MWKWLFLHERSMFYHHDIDEGSLRIPEVKTGKLKIKNSLLVMELLLLSFMQDLV